MPAGEEAQVHYSSARGCLACLGLGGGVALKRFHFGYQTLVRVSEPQPNNLRSANRLTSA